MYINFSIQNCTRSHSTPYWKKPLFCTWTCLFSAYLATTHTNRHMYLRRHNTIQYGFSIVRLQTNCMMSHCISCRHTHLKQTAHSLAHNCHLLQALRKVFITNAAKFVMRIRFNLLRGLLILLHHLICLINTYHCSIYYVKLKSRLSVCIFSLSRW